MRPVPRLPYILLLSLSGLAGGVIAASGSPAVPAPGPASASAPAIAPALALLPPAGAAGAALPAASLRPAPSPVSRLPAYRAFPALYSPAVAAGASLSFDIPDEADMLRFREESQARLPVLANNQVLAFYGHPNSRRMGILGEYPKEDLARLLKGYAELYDEANGPAGVIPAFYLIYGTCWPEGEIGYLRTSIVEDYIEYARKSGMLVFVDHQIGRFPVADAVKRLLPFLKYPNVHLALDPEWRTTLPMKEIGTVSADEINAAQAMVQDYLDREGIPGVKILVVHQFKGRMIPDRARVRADFGRVLLVHTADGFGPPALKRHAYAFNSQATNMPLKGFKLFFKSDTPGAGFDEPLLTPPEVLALEPRPSVIIYQ